MHPRQSLLTAILVAAGLLDATPAATLTDPSVHCETAAREAAKISGVPYDVLLAVSVVETGRDGRPWPWTVNVGGDGSWFGTVEEAQAHAAAVLDQGLTNVDLGCFQLNYRWHAEHFTSIADMLDPKQNATYAAEFLARQFAKTGDWALAAAAYHSSTPEFADAYLVKFEAAYARSDTPSSAAEDPRSKRANTFPLLVAGVAGAKGSLVPSTASGLRLIGEP